MSKMFILIVKIRRISCNLFLQMTVFQATFVNID